MLILATGLVAVVAAVGIVAYLVASRTQPADVPIAAVPVTPTAPAEPSVLFRRSAALGRALTRPGYAERSRHRLDLAGNPDDTGLPRMFTHKGLGAVGGALVGLLFGAKHGMPLLLVAPLGLGLFGLMTPDIVLRNRGEKRQLELRKRLPDALDMMTVCVEAGTGFDAALGRVARTLDGPVAEECARVVQEIQFGKSRTEALRALAERTTVEELRSFVSAVVQSGDLGISIGDVLRDQSLQLRLKRRQRAEEQAQKLQVKLLLPLIMCLLPAMFIVVLGPAVLHLVGFFHQMG